MFYSYDFSRENKRQGILLACSNFIIIRIKTKDGNLRKYMIFYGMFYFLYIKGVETFRKKSNIYRIFNPYYMRKISFYIKLVQHSRNNLIHTEFSVSFFHKKLAKVPDVARKFKNICFEKSITKLNIECKTNNNNNKKQ